jgi:ribosomal protein L37AE/L43A
MPKHWPTCPECGTSGPHFKHTNPLLIKCAGCNAIWNEQAWKDAYASANGGRLPGLRSQ